MDRYDIKAPILTQNNCISVVVWIIVRNWIMILASKLIWNCVWILICNCMELNYSLELDLKPSLNLNWTLI
jgi:hypothetical protein